MNPIQKLIQSEINCLIEKSNGYQAINHNSTKGSLREALLIDFFKKLIPSGLSISSGIICDSLGKSSTQTDFIVYDSKVLPNLILDKDLSMIPVESVFLTSEIKSTLRTKDLEQVEKSRASLVELKLSILPTAQDFKIPSVVIAFDNEVSQQTLIDWMKKQNDVVSICIIDNFCLSKTKNGIETFSPDSSLPEHWETLNFSMQLFDYLTETMKNRILNPLWGAYLQGADKFKEINNIK
ncbi:DUF6602 domain-containing protein [Belliella pelovolcani]|uniref:DUF6602 domain-containing protein n=1 Tax=Belliella pelovolcani TaxID=529505 RepID=UPI00391C0B9C